MYNVSLHNIQAGELGDFRLCQHQQPSSIHKKKNTHTHTHTVTNSKLPVW